MISVLEIFPGPNEENPIQNSIPVIRCSLRQRRHNVSECIPILSHEYGWLVDAFMAWILGRNSWHGSFSEGNHWCSTSMLSMYVYVSLPWAHVATWNIMEYHGHHGRSFRYMETQVNSICDPGCRWSPRPKETDHPGIGGIFFIPWPERTRCFHTGFWLFQ